MDKGYRETAEHRLGSHQFPWLVLDHATDLLYDLRLGLFNGADPL